MSSRAGYLVLCGCFRRAHSGPLWRNRDCTSIIRGVPYPFANLPGTGDRLVNTRDVYTVRIYPRSGFLRSGSIKPHRSVRFVAADIRSVTICDFSHKRISDPLRSVAHYKNPNRSVTFSRADIHSAIIREFPDVRISAPLRSVTF